MKQNKTLFIKLLVLSAFLSGCVVIPPPVKITDIPPSYFEENRGEGERLVYITVERSDVDENGSIPVTHLTDLFIVTDTAAIENLTDPVNTNAVIQIAGITQYNPSIQNSIGINGVNGLAVFSLPKSQEDIGLAYYCSRPVESEEIYTGVTIGTEFESFNGHGVYKIPPESGDLAIRVILSPRSGDENVKILTSTNNNNIEKIVSGCTYYSKPFKGGAGTPGFIAAPVQEKK
ncbi:MAG: hypothetical protein LBR47_03935 [Spirochaetaceae bacterium]|jgi:hypothetical protein|nr:hypothetical protein [Spirochaetaceae bacterium]